MPLAAYTTRRPFAPLHDHHVPHLSPPPGGGTPAHAAGCGRSASRWWWIGGAAVLAVFAYVPLLAVRPGVVTPDTKTYLYLDPLRFLSQVAFMWDPTVGLGTVTHEYIGYLLPMGPFFAVFHLLGVPVWVAQRLWLGSILFVAGARRPLPVAHPRPARARADGGRAGLHALARTSCSTPGASR